MSPYRRTAAMAVPLGLLVALTAAQLVHRDDTTVELAGVTFDLEAAGSATPGWVPAEADWHPSTRPVQVEVPDDTPAPGGTVDVRVAVRNASGVPAAAVVALADPDPTGPGDLFDALHVRIAEDGVLLAEGPAPEVLAALPGDLPAERRGHRVLDVTVRTPATGDDRWAGVRTGVQVVVEGTSR
ncbi:hypothetical protein [Cellulomonas pakistanensis]|uniref:Uncharacterized protein n=1 Tax=Cellulomonas pakistanensis TaxID=992287 RepID=A0A919P912_9CELL|nr:hypothetical protein [Cellulomonas pakistanensis]GIG36585.1 hypothetical protein Cpa01nite_19660 [Cellulomonas pakistanensis]